jgi:hypothetical protein
VVRPDATVTYEVQQDLVLTIDEDLVPEVDLTPRVEALMSAQEGSDVLEGEGNSQKQTIDAGLLSLLNWSRIYRTLWRYRDAKGYTNLTFGPSILRRLSEQEHYVLRCPDGWLDYERFEDLEHIESTVLRILRTYITQFHSSRKKQWEEQTLRYETLTEDDDNLIDVIEARVKESEQAFLTDLLDRLDRVETEDEEILYTGDDVLYEQETGRPPRVYFEKHLYFPLVVQENDVAEYSPQGLNTGEKKFMKHLRAYLRGTPGQEFMDEGRTLYVLRNQTRGKGVGFQMEKGGRFFPDFILWLVEDDVQHIVFVDPKGLNVGVGNVDAEPKIGFCQQIGSLAQQINEREGRDDVQLHGFIFSTTEYQTLKTKQTLDSREDFWERNSDLLDDGASEVQRMMETVTQ